MVEISDVTYGGVPARAFRVHLHTERQPRRWLPFLKRTTWWTDSPDAPGWSAVADTEAEVKALVIPGLRLYVDDYESTIYVAWRGASGKVDPTLWRAER